MPGAFDLEGYKNDVKLLTDLVPLSQSLSELLQAIDDTILAIGSDAMVGSFEVYDSLKNNVSRIPGLQAYVERIKPYFAKRKSSVTTTATAPAA